ncbi:MAG TPA: phosphoethanolamine--lipid A transferase [Burkholderiaceae bacterium]|nr:phosphoethanolamine--lipid A transferase [Burkholderiaceae bacterium]
MLMPPSMTPPASLPIGTSGASGVPRLARHWLQDLRHHWAASRSPQFVAVVLSAWLATVGNLALWHRLGQLYELSDPHGALRLQLGGLVLLATLALLLLLAWPRFMKPVWGLVLVVAACAQHFMLEYGIFIDAGMVLNATHTNASEARDLLGWHLLANVLLIAGLPLAWLVPVPIQSRGVWRNIGRSGALLAFSVAALLGGIAASYRDLAPLTRNHKELRYLINPLSTVVAAGTAVLKPLLKKSRAFLPISAGALLGASYAQQARPPLFVLVVGETARADHFALNGYPRNTTPELAARGVLSWHKVHSCGTNTLASVPCMFSHLGKEKFEQRSADHENLLDVLQAAGLAVLWVDNQAGCKGVCDRVASASTSDAQRTTEGQALCRDDECQDEMMLKGLDERLTRLPEQQRRNGVVLVMHQMGSHGPAYYRRSTPETKRFQPECTSHALADCTQDALVNAYDNSIAYTDHFLAKTIDWLQRHKSRHDVGMLYLSDHGESLGEYGLFLHGVPYAVAPEVQKHVPMVVWPGSLLARRDVDAQCLKGGLDSALTHDNLYHTVLGALDVRTPTYQRGLDAFAGCRPG